MTVFELIAAVRWDDVRMKIIDSENCELYNNTIGRFLENGVEKLGWKRVTRFHGDCNNGFFIEIA